MRDACCDRSVLIIAGVKRGMYCSLRLRLCELSYGLPGSKSKAHVVEIARYVTYVQYILYKYLYL